MKCVHCGKAPWQGVTLIRQNEKGVAGIWACEQHNRLPVPQDVAQVVAEIQGMQRNPNENTH